MFDKFTKKENVIFWEGKKTLDKLSASKRKVDKDIMRISAVSNMQFGKGASKSLFDGKINIIN